MENENKEKPSVPVEKSSCAYAYSLCMIKMLKKADLLTQEQYYRIEGIIDDYYQSM